MNDRRYFILEKGSQYEGEALDACIGDKLTQRYRLDGAEVIIKACSKFLAEQGEDFVEKLGVEYSIVDLKPIILSSLWQNNDPIG